MNDRPNKARHPTSLSPTDAVTVLNHGNVTLTIDRTTATFSGVLPHTNGSRPSYAGVIHQKRDGNPDFGFGFFLTVQPTPKDYKSLSGTVWLYPRP